MNTEIAEKIKNMLVENLRIPADELEYTSELFGDDIGLDSIDSIEIIAGIDNLFGVQMTGAARENFQTIETLTKLSPVWDSSAPWAMAPTSAGAPQ